MSGIRVATIQANHAGGIQTLLAAHNAVLHEPPTLAPVECLADAIRDDALFGAYAMSDDVPVGVAIGAMWMAPDTLLKVAYLSDMYIVPEARRRGLSRLLTGVFSAEAKRRDASILWWSARADNAAARSAYRSFQAEERDAAVYRLTGKTFETWAALGQNYLDTSCDGDG